MGQIRFDVSRLGSRRLRWIVAPVLLLGAMAWASTTWATPPLGFVVNEILASGFAARHISEHVQIGGESAGRGEREDHGSRWQLQLQVQGDTDYYDQHLVLSPGGYSGWHSHPGLLVGAVNSGQIEFYDERCRKRVIRAGQVFTESNAVHAIKNVGGEDAVLYISYLVVHGAARRIEEAAPACASVTGIP
jgi:quercetin dioxygenase-like cupin family protein